MTVPRRDAASQEEWRGNARRRRALAAAVFVRDGDTCHLCGRPGATTVDHLVPLSKGGPVWDPANMAPAHKPCNGARGDTDLAEWFRRHPITRSALTPSREW